MTGPRHLAVVGGGLGGLLAAHEALRRGCRVTVLEASDRPGGMVESARPDGWVVDTGATTIGGAHPRVMALLDALGMAECRVVADPRGRRRYLVHRGRLAPVPETPAEMVASPLLSVAGRLRMLKEPFVARGGDPDETVAAFARRRFGEEAAAHFFDPLVVGTSGGDPEQLLASAAFPQLVRFERTAGSILKGRMRAARTARREGKPSVGAWSCREGLDTLPARLAAALGSSWRPGARVDRVASAGDVVQIGLASGETVEADAAVVTVPATALAAIRWTLDGADALGALGAMPHASLATVSLGFPRDAVAHPLDGHGLLAASGERRRFLTVLFTSTLFPHRAPADQVLLTATFGGVRHPTDAALDDDALVALALEELRPLLGVGGVPSLRIVRRWPAALPLAMAGHRERCAAVDAVEESSRRVAFSGAWRDGLALADVMRGAIAAVDRLLGTEPAPPGEE